MAEQQKRLVEQIAALLEADNRAEGLPSGRRLALVGIR